MRVLYVNHTSVLSGGERSLLALLGALPDEVQPHAAIPRGPLYEEIAGLGVPASAIVGTAGSLRLHPLHTPRALAEMGAAAAQVRLARRRASADVVHANSIRAAIVAGLAVPRSRAIVAHVRDCLPPGPVSSASMRLIAATAGAVVANSAYTAASVRSAAPGAAVDVVHSPVDLERFDPARIDRDQARARLGDAGRSAVLLGVVAQLTPWKGQHTAIEALRLVVAEGLDAHLLLVGSAKFVASSTRFDNEAYVASLKEQVERGGLNERVSFLGERADVPELIRAMDAVLVPSEEEPFGRTVVEAMALEVPVLATSVGGPAEIVEDGRHGFLLAPDDAPAWAAAIRTLAADPELSRRMGAEGRRRALAAFGLPAHVRALLDIYRRLAP